MAGRTMQVYVDGVGVWSPGLKDWGETRAVLQGHAVFSAEAIALPAPAVLPAAERRRAPATAKVAVQVAAEACVMAASNPSLLPSVFASSHGDTHINDYMCRELAANAPLSPTKFHNSVHNAASGYWTIAVGSMQSSSAISAGDHSLAYGLLEAAAYAVSGGVPVLLVAYDLAAPMPLATVCAISRTFGVGLVLSPIASDRSVARLEVQTDADAPPDTFCLPPALNALMAGNPAARSLPLLSCIARGDSAVLALPPFCWEITPCR
jgi:Beta-ketoacyl synthase, N-terminal domain